MPNATLTVVLNMDDDDLATKIVKNQSSLVNFAVTVNQAGVASKNLDLSVQSLGASFAGWNAVVSESVQAFRELSSVTIEYGEKILELNSSIQKTTLLLKGLSHATNDADRSMEAQTGLKGLLDMAADSPFKLDTLTDTFVKLKTAGIDPMDGSMKALMDSISAFGGDDSRLKRAGYAIQEMAGRGVISLQNLRRQLGQDIPGAVELMARSMNMSVEELDKKVTTGTLNSAHALNLLFDEFGRTYGGASGQMMQTFEGRVNQITNSMQRLALVVGGTVKPSLDGLFGDVNPAGVDGGLYSEAVKQVKSVNDMLKSPEMVASAVSLEIALTSLVKDAGEFARTVIEWREPITSAIETIGEIVTALVAWKAAMFAISLPGKLLEGFSLLKTSIMALPAAFRMFESVGGLAANMLMGLGQTVVDVLIPGFATVEVGIEAALGALAGFSIGLSALAIPVALTAGFFALNDYIGRTTGYATIASDAVQRLLLGDITSGNVSKAQEQIVGLNEHIQATKDKIAQLEADEDRGFFGRLAHTLDGTIGMGVSGFGDTPAVPDMGDRSKALDQEQIVKLKAQLAAFQETAVTATEAAAASVQERLSAVGHQSAQALLDIIDADGMKLETAYRNQLAVIEASRAAMDALPGNHDEQRDTLVQAKGAADKQLFDDRTALTKNFLDRIQKLYDDAGARGDADKQAEYGIELDTLHAHLDQMTAAYKKGLADQAGADGTGGDKAGDKAKAESATLIENMTIKVAQLNAEMANTGTSTAKVLELLKQPGWTDLPDATQQSLKRMAAYLDATKVSLKNFHDAERDGKNIDLGFDKAAEDLARYSNQLTDGKLTTGQRMVSDLQFKMNLALSDLAAKLFPAIPLVFNLASANRELADATRHAAEAQRQMANAGALADADEIIAEAHRKLINSYKGDKKVAAQAADDAAKYATAHKELKAALDASTTAQERSTNAQRLAALEGAQSDFKRADSNQSAGFDAKAMKPGEEAINGMKDKIAELIAAMRGGDTELAKWNQKIADQPAVYGKSAEALRALATAQDVLIKSTEKSKAADEALKSLQKTGTDLTIKREDIDAENKLLNVKSRILDVEKQIVAFQVSQDRTVAVAEAQLSDKELVAKKGLLKIEQEIAAAKAQAAHNENENTMIVMDEKLLDLKKQMIEADGKSAKGYKENSQLINDEAAQLIELYKSAATASHVSATQQEADIKTITDWAAAEHAALAKKDADYFQKLINDWGDAEKQIGEVGKTALDGFNSQLETALTKGKANWKDFTDSVIKDLIGMILKMTEAAALQQALSAMGVSTEGSGTGLGAIGGGIMSMLGLGGSSASGVAAGSGDFAGAGVSGWHSGGVLGSDTSTFTRSISSSEFANAIRYHTGGIAGDEVPSILQKGEGVFTSGQMAQIGDLNSGYMSMAANISRLVDTMTNPPSNAMTNAMPGSVTPTAGQAGGSGAGMQHIFNINNQSPTPVTATQTGSRREGDQMIIDIIMKAASQPGPLRSTLATVGR